MTANPFQAPSSNIARSDGRDADVEDDRLYCVSKKKFLALYILTFGTYAIYWSYKNWSLAKRNEGIPVWPIMRGLFLIFFMHGLMRKASEMGARKGFRSAFAHQAYATSAVVMLVVERIFDRMSRENIGFPLIDIIGIATVFILAHIFWKMQDFINAMSGDPLGQTNEKFTGWNILWIVLGSVLWGMVVIGYLALIAGAGGHDHP